MTAPLTFRVEEFAALIGVSPGCVYGMVQRGELRHVRAGRRVLIPRTVLAELGLTS